MSSILLISTSGRAASAAIAKDGITIKQALSDSGLTHSETIMPLIDSLFYDGDIAFYEPSRIKYIGSRGLWYI